MKSRISLLLIVVIFILSLVVLSSCTRFMEQPTINGVKLSKYVIVYDEQGLDYNKRAAEYIQSTAHSRYGVDLKIVDDNVDKNANEIVVGETSRPISAALNVETEGVEFSILAKEGSIALEGDYFVIAAAAYYFMESFALTDAQVSSVPEVAEVHQPIVKEAKNYILLIGDGMGVYQTKIFEYMDYKSDFGDGEDMFFGYMLPYMGESRTESLSGVTDSAAGGTALACGRKTYNKYLGLDADKKPIKSLTELAYELGMSAGVMSTETESGATPSSFLVHVEDRNKKTEIYKAHIEATQKYGTIIDCGYDYTSVARLPVMEGHIEDTLALLSANENGFFLMYEEAYIDKKCHNNNLNDLYNMVARFNQAIGRFMEFAFYNPDTFVLITADHETGELYPEEDGTLKFHFDDHSAEDVLIFAYGDGAELFDGVNIENIQIAHTIAAFMGDENFGDQSVYQSLTKTVK